MGKNPLSFENEQWEKAFNFIHVDSWIPNPTTCINFYDQDIIFTTVKGAILAPITKFYKGPESSVGEDDLDFFIVTTKKCYNSQVMRIHICHYLNYFEKFYDIDKEYFVILANLKWLIDYNIEYNKKALIFDICRCLLSPSLLAKTLSMSRDNYTLSLSYKNITNPSLQYTDDNAITLMQMSLLMNMAIPLLTHFAYIRKITDIDDFLLEVFDEVFHVFDSDVDMYNKIYETSITNVSRNEKNNKPLWDKQEIRGKNVTTHSMSSVDNIILNIMPKYTFDKNNIYLNYTSINNNTGFQVIEIGYEFSYISLSSSKRDEDNVSEFDELLSTYYSNVA